MNARLALLVPLALALTPLSCGRSTKVRTESTTGFMTVESADTSSQETKFRVGVSLRRDYAVQDVPLTRPVPGAEMSAGSTTLYFPVLEVILGKPGTVMVAARQPAFALVETRTGDAAYGRILDGMVVKVCVKTFDEAAGAGTADVEVIESPGGVAGQHGFYSVNSNLPFRLGDKVELKEFQDWPAGEESDPSAAD